MPYVRIDMRGPRLMNRTSEITTSDPKILAAWIMEHVGYMADGRDQLEIRIHPLVAQTGTGPQDFVTDWPQNSPQPFVHLDEQVPARAFVLGLRAALEAFLETL